MVKLEIVSRIYRKRSEAVSALDNVSVTIERGQFVVLRGASGSGKTTLLMAVAGMQHPTAGSVIVNDENLYAMSNQGRAKFRANNIGFIFQMFHLVPYLNVLENVLLAGGAAKNNNGSSRAREILEELGLTGRLHHRPAELSAGEKQRVAIARAMFNEPSIILADEPTGNLDPDNAAVVLGHLSDFHKKGGTVIVVTHGADADKYADRTISLANGKIESDTGN